MPSKKGFRIWPTPTDPDQPYGPTSKQRLLFIDELPEEERPHKHPVDIVLYIGGARSGKSIGACGRLLSYCLKNPGCTAVVGAESFPLLQRTILKEIESRFTAVTPWDYLKAKPPIILNKPTQNSKKIVLANGSIIHTIHFSEPEVLRGIDASIIVYEEASLLKDSQAFEELCRRLSGTRGKVRQLILLTNPPRGGWITEKFKLDQLRDDFTGEPEPICPPCNCHICQTCLNNKVENPPEYIDGFCPSCGSKKKNDCPGNQIYMRVIQTGTIDNPHVPQDYIQSQKAFMDEKTYGNFIEGKLEDLRDGEVYKSFTDQNVYKQPVSFDPDKDIIWTLDFNFEPQCSVICQEEETDSGFMVKILHEIVKWNALPEHAAEHFCNLPEIQDWKSSGKAILIYGDPAGLYGTGNDLVPSFYQKIYDVLKKRGFKAHIMMRKPQKDALYKEPVKIPIAGSVDSLNDMLLFVDKFDDAYVRIKINPQCKNLIRSLRELKWMPDGKNIDKSCDKRAQRDTDKNKPHLMTHPSDALRYYIYKRFPVVRNKRGTTFFQVPGQSVVEIKDGKVSMQDRTHLQEEIKNSIEERRKKRQEKREQRENKKNSLGSYLRENGLWPGEDFYNGSIFG